jgi:hypothetical protein
LLLGRLKTRENSIVSFLLVTACHLKYQPIRLYSAHFDVRPLSPVVGDFNGDDRLDLAILSQWPNSVNVLLGNGNGTFGVPITRLTEISGIHRSLVVSDFNNDYQLDLAFAAVNSHYVVVLLGYGDGTFRERTKIPTGNYSLPLTVTVAELNGDSYLDIAFPDYGNDSVGVLLGNGDGTFSTPTIFSTETGSGPTSVAVGYFNNDGYLDIVVANSDHRNVGLLLGHGNGTFKAQETFATGSGRSPISLIVADLNADNCSDVVYSHQRKSSVGMMFGYCNGTLSTRKNFLLRTDSIYEFSHAVADFNRDTHSDIVFAGAFPYVIDVLLGDGNGNFAAQTLLLDEDQHNDPVDVAVGDFNGDGYQDIVGTNTYGSIIDILLHICSCCTI